MLEQMAPEIEREKKDAADAKDFLDMLEKTYAEAGGKLKTARSELERAQRDMGRAGATARAWPSGRPRRRAVRRGCQRDEQPDRRVEGDAGCGRQGSRLGRRGDEQGKASAPDQPEQDDPNIAAALAAAPASPRHRRV